ncbi:MAG: hypothetical protein K8F58_05935 [Bauldia sp.]|nr:hypothetical protein [Bauldia sp.]
MDTLQCYSDFDDTIRPLDPALNAAILHIATRLFPCGFDIADNAPGTYRQLKAHLDAGQRMVVYAGGCDHTIYADREINYAFRAWHDWCHYAGLRIMPRAMLSSLRRGAAV